MPTVLFVCEGNMFRSQMAESLFNASAPGGWRAVSAGTNARARVHPGAIALMSEVGIDISHQKPKALDPELAARARRVIAMCDIGGCPVEIRERTERWPIPDPDSLPEARWQEIRDEIERRVSALCEEIRSAVPRAGS